MKKLIACALALLICATASIGATWAYLTSGNEDANVMTVGRVKIEQLEYERTDARTQGEEAEIQRFHDHKPLYPGVHPDDFDFAVGDSWVGWDAIGKEGYTSGIWDTEVVRNELDKMVFVRNDGNREAYVRTIFAFETTADWSLNSFQKLIHLNNNTQDWSWAWIEAPVTIGEGLYYVAVATYQHILAPNALSEISLSQVLMDKSVAAEDFTKLGDTYQILVYTQAIQTDGFESPEAALNEGFGVIDTVLPFEGDAQGPGAAMYDTIRYLDTDGETDISTLVTEVVFGTYKDYPQIPLRHDGTLVSAGPGVETCAYYVQDDQEQYKVYILSDEPIYAPADCTGLFQSMTALTTVVTENLDVSRVENMNSLFKNCTALTTLDTTGWDTSAVTDMNGVFYLCSALTEIKGIESWNTGAATNMRAMFRDCGITGDLDLHNWDVSNVTDMAQMFVRCYNVTSVNAEGWDTGVCTNMSNMFWKSNNLRSINAAGWDTSSVTTMASMFYECFAMETLDVTGWDTSNVTKANGMFLRCRGLTAMIGSGDLNFSKVEQMASMCEGWDSMTYLDVTNWNCGSVTDMSQMFAWALKLETLEGIQNWDVSNVTNMATMFYDCNGLTELDLSGWDTSKVQNMSNMFRECDKLRELNLSGWDTSSVTQTASMFSGSTCIETIYVSDAWDMTNVTSSNYTFNNNKALVGGNGTKYSNSYRNAVYARIDLPAVVDEDGNVITPAVPGYLTHINDKP